MPKTKKQKNTFINELRAVVRRFEPASARLLLFGAAAVSLTYLCAIFVLCSDGAGLPDVSTALFWGGELLTLGKELLGGMIVPVLLFELLLIICGQKKRED